MTNRFPLLALIYTFIVAAFLLVSCTNSNPVTPSDNPAGDGNSTGFEPSLTTSELTQADDSVPSPFQTGAPVPYAPDEVLVSLNSALIPDISGESRAGLTANLNSFLSGHGLSLIDTIDDGSLVIYLLQITDGMSVPDKITELESLPVVDHAEPNITLEFCDIPYTANDPFFENPNDNDDDPRTTVHEMYGPAKIGATVVWDETIGNPSVVVCVMDSGIQVWHEDIENVMWTNPGEIPDNEIDDDLNGYIDDIYGWDTYEDDNDITEYSNAEYYHGTACAGVVAAEIDNELGCTGIAPGVRIMGVRIGFGYSFLSHVLNGILYARNNGADVLSMSFSTTTDSSFLEAHMNAAWGDGLVLVAAAANDNNQTLHYPAAYDSVVCVGGTTAFGKRWTYAPRDEVRIRKSDGYGWGSCYGPQLEVMAFGEFYITTHGGNDHKYWDGVNDYFFRGTSNSTPMVSGGFGLLKSLHPNEDNQWLRDRMRDTADDIEAQGYDEETGWGRINLVRACYGPDRYTSEEDENGFVDLATHENQIIDSIHAVSGPHVDTKDLYKFTATETGYVNFFMDIWTWGENLDLFIYSDPSLDSSSQIGQSVIVNHAWNSYEAVGLPCEVGETFYIKIIPSNQGDSTTYTIRADHVQSYLELEIETYDPGFFHLGGTDRLIGHLDFSSSIATHITEIIFNLQGGMPGDKLTGLTLYKDSYTNGNLDGLDLHVADAEIFGTNRAIFSDLFEEIIPTTSPTRYFLLVNLSGITVDSGFELVLTSYKDVTTYEGIEIAYDSFPYVFGPYEVGVDIEPPTWDSTVGIQATTPRYRAAGIFWNRASDPRTPPVDYNIYWDTELPFEFSTTLSESAVNFWEASDYDCVWVLPDLENVQEYFVVVRAIDQAGNEEDNSVYMSVTPNDNGDPTWPQLVGSYDTDGNNAREVRADPANQRVFVADDNLGVQIIDVSDPTEPSLVDLVEANGVKGVDYDGTYIYAAYASGLMIIDPDAVDGPEIVSDVPFADTLRVLVYGNWAYVTKNGTDMLPVDITDPLNPLAYPVVTSGDRGYALAAQDNYLFNATFNQSRILDITVPSAPAEIASFSNTQGHDILPIGETLYTAIWNSRKFFIYDILDPTNPIELGQWTSNSGWRGSTVVMFNGYLYFGTQSWGIEVLDITDPSNILEVGQIYTNGPDGMDTDGSFIYSAENAHGLKIFL